MYKFRYLIAIGIVAVMSVIILQMDSLKDYLSVIKYTGGQVDSNTGVSAQTNHEQTELYQRIVKEAALLKEEPINARVDRVWKAIPGYNGRQVNAEASFKKTMESEDTEKISFVFEEVQPEISLNDLGAHPIYKGNPNKPMAALMINVAWGNEHIEPMLKTLDEADVKATFFFDGSWLNKNVELAKEIIARGHEGSNHAYSHKDMSRLSYAVAKEEIEKTEQLIKLELGIENQWFAPPSGDFNQQTVDIAYELNLKTVLWTLDTVDWKNPPPQSVIQKIKARIEPGSLILMHPTPSSEKSLEGIIKVIEEKGLTLGTVSEVLSSKRPIVEQ